MEAGGATPHIKSGACKKQGAGDNFHIDMRWLKMAIEKA